MDFFLHLQHTNKGKDSILVVVYKFSKMTPFIDLNKTDYTKHVVDLLYRVVKLLKSLE